MSLYRRSPAILRSALSHLQLQGQTFGDSILNSILPCDGARVICYRAFHWSLIGQQCKDQNLVVHIWSPWSSSQVNSISKPCLFWWMQALGLSTASEKQKVKVEKKKKKKKKKSKRGIIKKLKQLRYITKIKKANMDHEQKLLARIERAKKKIESLQKALKDYELPPLPLSKHDPESLTAEELNYLKRLGYKHKNYMILGVRKIFGGVILNMHLHWKKHQLIKIKCKNFTREEINETGAQLARLSGGIVVDVQKGDTIVMYRGRNYRRPDELTPKNTLSKRKALFKAKFEQSLESTRKNLIATEKELALYREHKAKEEAGLFSQKPTVGYISSWSDTEDEQLAGPSVHHSDSEDLDVDPALVCDSDSVLETDSDADSQSYGVLDSEIESGANSGAYPHSLGVSDSEIQSDYVCDSESVLEMDSDTDSIAQSALDSEIESGVNSDAYPHSLGVSDSEIQSDSVCDSDLEIQSDSVCDSDLETDSDTDSQSHKSGFRD